MVLFFGGVFLLYWPHRQRLASWRRRQFEGSISVLGPLSEKRWSNVSLGPCNERFGALVNVAQWLVRTAHRDPDSPALLEGENQVATYREFAERSSALGRHLGSRYGVAPGDRVAIYMPNRPDYLVAMYGAWFAGAVIVPINAKLHWKEAADIIADSEAKVVVVATGHGEDFSGQVQRVGSAILVAGEAEFAQASEPGRRMLAPAERKPADPAWLFYTSGTTGKAKGAILSNANLIAMSLSYLADVDEVSAADAALYAAPMSHGAGLYNLVHVLRGSRHLVPRSGGFHAKEVLALARSAGPVTMFAAPTMVRRLTDAARGSSEAGEGIRTIIYGGGPMYVADLKDALDVFGNRFVQIYGQGETPMCITALPRSVISDRAHPEWERRASSAGVPQACVEVAIVDDEGRKLPVGAVGEIIVRGPTVMSGYWRAPEATGEALRDGWLWTGDLGSFDEDGFLTLIDRSKDVIISGGSNIYPREVEECLLLHPDVRQASVIGIRDPDWGEIVVAFIVARDGCTVSTTELDALCTERIARFKKPKRYFFLEELPANNYGKVLKSTLRAFLDSPLVK